MEEVSNCNDVFANDYCCVSSNMFSSKLQNAIALEHCQTEHYVNAEEEESQKKGKELISEESIVKTLHPVKELQVVEHFGLYSEENTMQPLNKRAKNKILSFGKNDKLIRTLYYNFTNNVNTNGNGNSAGKAKKEVTLRGHSYSRDKREKHLLGTRHFCTPPERRTRKFSTSGELLSKATKLAEVKEVELIKNNFDNECTANLSSPTRLLASDANKHYSAENLNKCFEIKCEQNNNSANRIAKIVSIYNNVSDDNGRNESNDNVNARTWRINSLENIVENRLVAKEKSAESLCVHNVTTQIPPSKIDIELPQTQILLEQKSPRREQTQKQIIWEELLVESSSDETSDEPIIVNDNHNFLNISNHKKFFKTNEEASTLSESANIKGDNEKKKELIALTKKQESKLYLENVHDVLDDNYKEARNSSTLDISAEKAKLRLLLCDDSESNTEGANKEETKEKCREQSITNDKFSAFKNYSLTKCQECRNDIEFMENSKLELVIHKRYSSAHSIQHEHDDDVIRESSTVNTEFHIGNQANTKDNSDLSNSGSDDDDVKKCLSENDWNDVKYVKECIRAKHYDANNLFTTEHNSSLVKKIWPQKKCKQREEEEYECEEQEHEQEELKLQKWKNTQEPKSELHETIVKAVDCENAKMEDDVDECCICLEEYSAENPKFVSECHHHFHLPCLLSWKQRCNTCPMCNMETIRSVNKEEDAKEEVTAESLISTITIPDTSNDEALARRLQQKYQRREQRSKQRNSAERIASVKDNKMENQTVTVTSKVGKSQEELNSGLSKERTVRMQSTHVVNKFCDNNNDKSEVRKSASNSSFNVTTPQSNKSNCQINQWQQNIFSLTINDMYAQSARQKNRRQCQREQTRLPPQQINLQASKTVRKDLEKSKPCAIM